jgi:hypothetical protein
MDALQLELAKLRRDANLTQSIEDVDKIIAQLERAREAIVEGIQALPLSCLMMKRGTRSLFRIAWIVGRSLIVWFLPDPNSSSITLAKLQNPLKTGFDKVNDDLNKTHRGQNKFGKALNTVCEGISFICSLLIA